MSDAVNLGAFFSRTGDPDKPLVIGVGPDAAEETVTRAALDASANAFARGLLAGGVERGERIAILSANRPHYVAVLLGAMRAGVVPVPINFKFPPATIADVVADCGARLVICDATRRAQLPPHLPTDVRVADLDADGAGSLAPWLDPGPFEPIVPAADEPALFLYTSGSTGRPKGVKLSHASHLWVARTRIEEVDFSNERVLIAAPLYHMNALALMLVVCGSGSTAVLLPQFEAKLYIDAISRYRCTWLTAVPPMIAMMLNEKATLQGADLTSVHTIRMGSAPVTDILARETHVLLPNARIINAYGTTEGGPVVFTDKTNGAAMPAGSLGRPHPGVAIRLTASETPDTGVLQMKSPAIMLGYHNRPDTRSPITPDGFYDTGDVFHHDDQGFYYFVGRADDMFVSGGENIFPSEVETVIERHPDVLQSCVVPVEDAIKGTKPVAFVVRRPGTHVDEHAIKQYVLANAPAYQHPRRVWFLDSMPLASTNKIDRAALRKRAEADLRAAAELRAG